MAFNFDIKERIAVLSESGNGAYATEVNMISFNGAEPKLDIRKWDKRTDRMLKGIALSGEEVEALKKALLQLEDES